MDTTTFGLIFFTLLGGALLIAFILELFELRSQKQMFAAWTMLVNEYIDGFDQLKLAINNNANLMKLAGDTINEHDRIIRVMAVVVDAQSEVLKINPELRDRLANPPVDGFIMTVGEDVE